jgi:hypothetical protein
MQTRYLVATVISVGLLVFYLVGGSGDGTRVALSDMFLVIGAALSAALSLLVLRRRGLSGILGRVQLGLFLGMLFWFLGETTWALYELVLNVETPYPSMADAFWLGGSLSLIFGVFGLLVSFRDGINRQRLVVSTSFGIIAVMLTAFFLLGPLLQETLDLLKASLDFAYPILDMMLLIGCIFIVMNNPFRGGKMAGSWFSIGLGMAFFTVFDILFSQGTLAGWYYSGNPIDFLYALGYVFLVVGFQNQRSEL